MRLFLDANILFSAAYRAHSAPAMLFELADAGYCELLTSAFALEEARRNLAAKSPERLEQLERLATRLRLAREPSPSELARAAEHKLPDKDAPILAAAIASGADMLITGDRRHFGHLFERTVQGVTLLRLSEALERLLD